MPAGECHCTVQSGRWRAYCDIYIPIADRGNSCVLLAHKFDETGLDLVEQISLRTVLD
jgi:hypothetical protein